MEQIKETVMINPEEWADTHLEAHKKINSAIAQFYRLFNELVSQFNLFVRRQEDADKTFASFSQLKDDVDLLKEDIKSINKTIEAINEKLDQKKDYLTRNYEWILDTDTETLVELEPIADLKWWTYLVNVIVNEEAPNRWTESYSFPKISLVSGEYRPRISLVAKQWEHAVLEYSFTIILTQL